jgi:hypothetical protein
MRNAGSEPSVLRQAGGFIGGTLFGGFALQYWVYPKMDEYLKQVPDLVKGILVFLSWFVLLVLIVSAIQGWPWSPRKRTSVKTATGTNPPRGSISDRAREFSILVPSIPPGAIWALQWIAAQPSKISIEAFQRDFGQYVKPDELRTTLEALSRHALIVRTDSSISITDHGIEFVQWVDTGKPKSAARPESREQVKTWYYDLDEIQHRMRDASLVDVLHGLHESSVVKNWANCSHRLNNIMKRMADHAGIESADSE